MEHTFSHVSVLLHECIEALNINPNGIYVDCTLGGGGHSLEIVKRLENGKLICIDQDAAAIEAASKRLADYKDKIIKATDISTIVTGKSFGHPVRSLKTPFSKTLARMEADSSVNKEEILAFGSGALRKAVQEGDVNGSYMAGESAGMVKNIESAKAIVEDIILGAEKVMIRTQKRIIQEYNQSNTI